MPSLATSSHLPVLDAPHEREAVSQDLEATLWELVDLSLVGKQLHWAIVGPGFRSLHLQLDEFVDSWRDLADEVAERAVALGHVPDGQAPALVAASPLGPVAAKPIEVRTATRLLSDRIAQASALSRERIARLADRDVVSQDVLIDVVRALEQHQWMLRVQLDGGT
jgi:starvation-inducible DNA-binding protein